ncbi:MAG: type II toxin-antitoxin system RelE/ParE family toxin [Micropepsaceae bacterium]
MSPREVVVSFGAENDVIDILSYIAERNPLAAGAMGAKFEALFDRIAAAPNAGTKSAIDRSMRRRNLGNYAIYYEFDDANDRIIIMAVVHGARIHHRMRDHQS